ncbi:arylformamidase [Edaphobacillus lindanitolerans]|uniref:Kynurenine formamidase n=1 Tax=Edaphobacillus lindanitolerans TaxID=550447 RepID=A0A1U7PKA6_9BACI|nr:arylformamidase [Edaphobacillus lindanitolerans]SIT84418.1 Kynurenine formamidase [Edaphobacillus lindanitolerans]
MKEGNWTDITQPLKNGMANWPGDTPFRFELSSAKAENGAANIGQMTTSLHMGTHADAPYHFDDDGKRLEQLSPDLYIGNARVVDVTRVSEVGRKELESFDLDGVRRLLLKTSATNDPMTFPENYTELLPDIGPLLKEKGIFLLGIDIPSVDRVDSKELATHHSLDESGVHIIENLMLENVEPGDYEFIALPLALHGADGSPVRAVIRPLG